MNPRAERFATEIKLDTLTGTARVLADEAVLIVDRLENLDRIITGEADAWLGIMQRAAGSEIAEITINVPLAEARQQASTLRALLSALAKVQGMAEPVAAPVSKSDDLARRRDERVANARGKLPLPRIGPGCECPPPEGGACPRHGAVI